MSDPNDILGKTDALLGRYRGGSKPAADLDFPVLTEVISADDLNIGPSQAAIAAPLQPQGTVARGELGEDRILQEVLRALAPQIDTILGDPLKELIEENVHQTIQGLTDQIRADLEVLLRAAMSRAVEQVLSEKNKP